MFTDFFQFKFFLDIQGRRPSPEGSESPPRSTPVGPQPPDRSPFYGSGESSTDVQNVSTVSADNAARKSSQPAVPMIEQGSVPIRSENIEILCHKGFDGTTAPPNTFVPSTSADKLGTPRSRWEESVRNRLDKFVNDSMSKKSSEKSSSSPSSVVTDWQAEMTNGHVETPADPQTVLTQSGEVL